MEGGAGNRNCLWKHCWSTNTTFMTFDVAKPNALWTKGEVPGTCYSASSRDRVDEELFLGWLVECFLQHSVSSCPLPLLRDGHRSHFVPGTIRIAKEENIIFCLAPHTTHKLQPLDYTLFGPLKAAWADGCHTVFKQHPGQVQSINMMMFSKAVAPKNILVGCCETKEVHG